MVEQVDAGVVALAQIGRGYVRHASCLLVIVRGGNIVQERVRVGELLECPVIYERERWVGIKQNTFFVSTWTSKYCLCIYFEMFGWRYL